MSIKCQFSELTFPNDPIYAIAAGKYVAEVANKIGFSAKDVQTIEHGLNKAVIAIIDYSFDPEERATLGLTCELIATGIQITLKDKGLPFGDTLMQHDVDAAVDDATAKFRAHVIQLRKYVDEVSLHNLGHKGKEIVLVKHLTSKTITDYYAECELEPYDIPGTTSETPDDNETYTVRRMRVSEAVEVSKTVYRAYGYSYAREFMYFPEKIVALNESGHLQSAVVIVGNNTIAGHCALQYWEANPRVAEMVAGVVKPEFRSRGYFAKLAEYLIREATNKALLGIFVHTVTNHPYSQKTGHRAGLQDCAIRLGLVPPTTIFKGFSDPLHQKLSIIIQFRYLNAPSRLVLNLPEGHQAIVAAIYRNLGVAPEFSANSPELSRDTRSEFKIQVVAPLSFARIAVEKYGENIVTEIRAELKALCYKKIEAVNLYLNLFDPLTAVMTEEFEKMGFFFAGVMPGGLAVGDALILQYLNNVPIDYSQIKITSHMAQQMIAYIKSLDPNTG
jgi:serine/threonine-protein kinase RsbW